MTQAGELIGVYTIKIAAIIFGVYLGSKIISNLIKRKKKSNHLKSSENKTP